MLRILHTSMIVAWLFSTPTSAQVVISEVQSANHQTLIELDGEAYDWIELTNQGRQAIDLAGWGLSDSSNSPHKWLFGDVLIAPEEHLIVRASGQDIGQGLSWNTLIDDGAQWSYRGGQSRPAADWKDEGFDDSAWTQGPSGLGFGYPNLNSIIQTDTLYARHNFTITQGELVSARAFTLHMDYDDGFIAYLNGHEVARSKLGVKGIRPPADELATDSNQGVLQWNQSPDRFQIRLAHDLLHSGQNVLAVEVHNEAIGDGDLCCTAFLSAGFPPTWTGPLQANPLLSFTELEQHLNFRLDAAGEDLFLTDPQGVLVDQLSTGRLYLDQSIGRSAIDGSTLLHFMTPTPGAPNSTEGRPGYVSAPTISPPSGLMRKRREIHLDSITPGAQLRFTQDGSEPTETSPLYQGNLFFPGASTGMTPLRVRAFAPGLWPSRVSTGSFFTQLPHTLPIISLVTDPENMWGANGLYSNTNAQQDRPVHVTMFAESGSVNFALDLGAKPHGHASLSYPQKPLALIARSGYGQGSIEHAVFGPEHPLSSFRRLLLRNAGQDFNRGMLRDGLCAEIMKGEDLDVSGFRPVATYINGEYWGIQNLRERHDKEYPAAHHDVDPHDIDLLELAGWEVHEGSNEEFFDLVGYLDNHDLSDPEIYAAVCGVLDVRELSNYAIAQDFLINEDWPHNNVKFWSPHALGGKWRWFQYDFDGSLGAWGSSHTENRIDTVFSGSHQITDILQHLRASPLFNREFVNHYADLLNTSLSPSRTTGVLQGLSDQLEDEMPRHLERWNQSTHNWALDIQEIEHFLSQRPPYARQHLAAHFGLSGATYSLSLDISPPNTGRIELTAHEISEAFTGTYFQGNPVSLRARTRPGFSFAGWSDGVSSAERTIDPSSNLALTAIFQHGPNGSGQAVIAELQYHASDEHDTGDWVELQNPGAAYLDLSGWTLTDDDPAHSFTIPQGTMLAPGSPIVIARDLLKFGLHHPSIAALGPFGFGLSNSADSVRLLDASGALVDALSYTDHSPWTFAADGTGRSLELIDPTSDNAEASSWGASRAPGGTPAELNSLSAP